MAGNIRADLIPRAGVHITRAYSPPGFYVARYDAEGFTESPRWFENYGSAVVYAEALRREA